jgi:hypothetical protein
MAEISNTDSNGEALMRTMDDILLNVHLNPQTPREFFRCLGERVSTQGLRWDEGSIFNHWSWLQRIGVVVLSGVFDGARWKPCPDAKYLEHFYVTSRGRALLGSHETSPHNPVRFYARIKGQIASVDDVVMIYLDDAVGAWGAGLNRAVAVMIGCACERLIFLLAESLSKANVPPYSEKIEKELQKATKSPISISTVFEKVRETLLVLARERRLPGAISDALDRKLTPIFEYSRALRNASGHPTAVPVSHEDAEASLLLFPGFYIFVDSVIRAVSETSSEVKTPGPTLE